MICNLSNLLWKEKVKKLILWSLRKKHLKVWLDVRAGRGGEYFWCWMALHLWSTKHVYTPEQKATVFPAHRMYKDLYTEVAIYRTLGNM